MDCTYNLQGRLETVTTAGVLEDLDSDTNADDRNVEVAAYTYNPAGIRVDADVIRYDVTDYGQEGETWTKLSSSTTDYLVDSSNHTGFPQVLEEMTVEYNASDVEASRTRIQYTIGDDVISQTESTSTNGGSSWTTGNTQYLVYDGHGCILSAEMAQVNAFG